MSLLEVIETFDHLSEETLVLIRAAARLDNDKEVMYIASFLLGEEVELADFPETIEEFKKIVGDLENKQLRLAHALCHAWYKVLKEKNEKLINRIPEPWRDLEKVKRLHDEVIVPEMERRGWKHTSPLG